MKKEKPLSEKMIRIIDEVSDDGINWETIRDDDLFYAKDVKQRFKKILDEISKLDLDPEIMTLQDVIFLVEEIIKEEAGFEELK